MTFRQSTSPQVVSICTSQALRRFDLPLLRSLSKQYAIAQWEYCQDPDEPVDVNLAIASLHEYLQCCQGAVHLVGHGIAGLIGWLYTRQYPDHVRSLTLLSVGINLTTSWHSHYYKQRQLMSCSRETMLMRTAFYLFGYRDLEMLHWLADLLKQDLDSSLIPYSFSPAASHIMPTAIPVPILVCGAMDDYVIGNGGTNSYQKWRSYLKDSDRLWLCEQGKHFFHYTQWQAVNKQIRCFWQSLNLVASRRQQNQNIISC
ncbi:MAG: alpha/beta fold hydrolase [Pseudanabaena sp.]|jgi:pimeloyl-ACP methyl ester carboxylesterase|nr:alpha/beta hydrolase [Pseudanabaena sp. M53BS1SP1A06MG]MCA6582108.1 alpha/beta hydrolase [Pseudanabaena sp. M34BS1SP1A06MG]MCA6586869.1 alpha/beta hydrolase [Pseudanabaena sp. M051S1SP1A06QC]MCA6589779.1 alpha/beta hydrolase [Pseudanabaena sp. M109S1SP1A06QC]MCA6592217.1 alpha/beta hydrolase [Pseudanabaena sp. M38BS1SP1A06MG]MCA6597152.1 alpha/beta hydrolase [Pseudanabaena sp. M046S1SP1A06QC]MCA6599779.1 alpha/beta hydrolase [Pseudanabaena sp. M57BS1SP1A06MG]MCA6613893.1 alpha/beta hydrol